MRRLISYFLVQWLVAQTAQAALAPTQDANEAVFTAAQVVIVRPMKNRNFKVERTYMGSLSTGAEINVPAFKPVTFNRLDDDEEIVPLTENTRILMFLAPDQSNPAALAITEYGYGYFFRDLSKMEELDKMAKTSVAARQKWQTAYDIADRHQRIAALFPFLQSSNRACAEVTLNELAKLNPESGDYAASLLVSASPADRMRILLAVRRLHTPKSHAAAIAAVNSARERFNHYLQTNHLENFDMAAHSNNAPKELNEASGAMFYGLMAIHTFMDRADLPYIRNLCPFLSENNMNSAVEECVNAMGQMFDPQNTAVLKTIWENYKLRHFGVDDQQLLPIDLADAAANENDIAAVPMLLEILDIKHAHDSAINSLRVVTEKEFTTDAQWRSWYASQSPIAAHPSP